ncbi:MAG: histidine phosphatase family protein, partial [Oscillospiraceae bacterium]|nr:histidine phosphatase family protein [Oscillospiraceae bacterium]
MTRITIIRHAEAEGNYYRRAHGHYDSLLTPNGIAQTEALRERMKDVLFDAVYSSDLYRTKRTASVLRGWDGSPTHLLPSLRELCLGSWEDVPWGELAESDASALSIFMHQPGQ